MRENSAALASHCFFSLLQNNNYDEVIITICRGKKRD